MNKKLSFTKYEIIQTTLNKIDLKYFIFVGEISFDYYQLGVVNYIEKNLRCQKNKKLFKVKIN